jgi:hypothetical protein
MSLLWERSLRYPQTSYTGAVAAPNASARTGLRAACSAFHSGRARCLVPVALRAQRHHVCQLSGSADEDDKAGNARGAGQYHSPRLTLWVPMEQGATAVPVAQLLLPTKEAAVPMRRMSLETPLPDGGSMWVEHVPGALRRPDLPWLPTSDRQSSLARTLHGVHTVLSDYSSCKLARLVSLIMTAAILVSVAAFIAESLLVYRLRAIAGEQGLAERVFSVVDAVCSCIFAAEYAARLVTVSGEADEPAPAQAHLGGVARRQARWLRAVIVFILTPLNIVDLVSFLPFFVRLDMDSAGSLSAHMAILRVLRVGRMLRLVRLAVHSKGMRLLARTMAASSYALTVLLVWVLLGLVFFGSVMFWLESGTYDAATGAFLRPTITGTGMEVSPFQSIPQSMYFIATTLSTTGYGDMVPTSAGGRFVANCLMLVGVVTIALPVTIIGGTFQEHYAGLQEQRRLKRERLAAARAARRQSATGTGMGGGAGGDAGEVEGADRSEPDGGGTAAASPFAKQSLVSPGASTKSGVGAAASESDVLVGPPFAVEASPSAEAVHRHADPGLHVMRVLAQLQASMQAQQAALAALASEVRGIKAAITTAVEEEQEHAVRDAIYAFDLGGSTAQLLRQLEEADAASATVDASGVVAAGGAGRGAAAAGPDLQAAALRRIATASALVRLVSRRAVAAGAVPAKADAARPVV